jgi:hypothetical protein
MHTITLNLDAFEAEALDRLAEWGLAFSFQIRKNPPHGRDYGCTAIEKLKTAIVDAQKKRP